MQMIMQMNIAQILLKNCGLNILNEKNLHLPQVSDKRLGWFVSNCQSGKLKRNNNNNNDDDDDDKISKNTYCHSYSSKKKKTPKIHVKTGV